MNPPPRRLWQHLAAWLVAAAVGAGVLWLSDLLQAPSPVAFAGHGERFQEMTVDPLALQGKFPQRVLWPLLAHLLGFAGERAPLFSQVCNGLLLATVFWFCRQRAAGLGDALLVTLCLAATGAVQIYKTMTCYSDTLSFVLLLLAWYALPRGLLFWSLVLLSALSHEMVFFFAPWLVYERCRAGGRFGREVAALGATAAVYAAWLAIVRAHGAGQQYGIAYYLANNFWLPWGVPGLLVLLLLLVVVEFGPLLIAVVWSWRTGQLGMGRWGPWLYGAGMLLTLVFAYDVMRFCNFVFLPLVLGCLALLRAPRGRTVLAVLLVAAVASYACLHDTPGEVGGWAFARLPTHEMLVRSLERYPGRQPLDTPASAAWFQLELLARTWRGFAALLAAAAALAASGWWLARRLPGGGDGDDRAAGAEPRPTTSASP
ncbi:MAG TPA: hypothetical protein VFZ65_01265 [Planctomycetota bacterium]|nr:hypothetical protein [Planctomycetota bacterium]